MSAAKRPRQALHQGLIALLVALIVLAATQTRLRPLEERLLDGGFGDTHRQVRIDPSM